MLVLDPNLESTSEEYIAALNKKVSKHLRTYFHDNTPSEVALISNVMRQGRGHLNPNQVIPIIRSFLKSESKSTFEYVQK